MRALKVLWPLGQKETRVGCRLVNQMVVTGWEGDALLELRDGGGKQWTVESRGKAHTNMSGFLVLALALKRTHQHPRLLLGRHYSDCSFIHATSIHKVHNQSRTIFKGIKLAH